MIDHDAFQATVYQQDLLEARVTLWRDRGFKGHNEALRQLREFAREWWRITDLVEVVDPAGFTYQVQMFKLWWSSRFVVREKRPTVIGLRRLKTGKWGKAEHWLQKWEHADSAVAAEVAQCVREVEESYDINAEN